MFYVTFYGNAVEMCFVMFLIWIILPISSDITHIKIYPKEVHWLLSFEFSLASTIIHRGNSGDTATNIERQPLDGDRSTGKSSPTAISGSPPVQDKTFIYFKEETMSHLT